MKWSVTVTCQQCGQPSTHESSGTQELKDAQCPKCSVPFWFIKPLGDFVGMTIFNRAWQELQKQDFTLVIVLSAMAVECNLAYLFSKWKEIEMMDTKMPVPQADKDAWIAEWNGIFEIKKRLNKLSTFLTGKDFDAFLSANTRLMTSFSAAFAASGCTSPRQFFVQELFYRRNRIVHSGAIDFQQSDADTCFTLAAKLFEILKEMDAQRLKVLDKKLAG
jgi:hypothetical protein